MSSLRRSVPILKEICTQTCRKQLRREFHNSVSVNAISSRAARAKKVQGRQPRAQGSQTGTGTKVKKTYPVEEMLPPISLIQMAHKVGAIKSDPGDCITYLQVFAEGLATQCIAQDKEMMANSTITPHELGVMGSILNRCQTNAQKSLGRRLMISACASGNKAATFELMSSAIRTNRVDDYFSSMLSLGRLATKEDDPQAMLLLGRISKARGDSKSALQWFQLATQPRDGPPEGNIEWPGAAEALVEEGRMLQAQGAKLAAKMVFERAARELDDPTAYFYLSKFEDPGSAKQEFCLKKASSAGILEAWHNLGALELSKESENEIEEIDDYGMAREWFLVAAADGFGLSMLNLAIMHKSVGDIEGAVDWLLQAEAAEGTSVEAKNLRQQWEDENDMEEEDES